MEDVAGRRVLITGSTGGLGRAMAEALARGGARVAITGREGTRAEHVAREVTTLGGEVVGYAMDVRDETAVHSTVERVYEHFDGLDVLVNNAGVGMDLINPKFFTEPEPFWTVSPQDFANAIATNLTGYFHVAREVTPRMVSIGTGKIINIGSSEATMRRKGFCPYGPSRAGSEALSHVMAADCAGTGVTVNNLAPGGATATGIVPADIPDELQRVLLQPEVMARPIIWMCSAESDEMTDESIIARDFDLWLARRMNGQP